MWIRWGRVHCWLGWGWMVSKVGWSGVRSSDVALVTLFGLFVAILVRVSYTLRVFQHDAKRLGSFHHSRLFLPMYILQS